MREKKNSKTAAASSQDQASSKAEASEPVGHSYDAGIDVDVAVEEQAAPATLNVPAVQKMQSIFQRKPQPLSPTVSRLVNDQEDTMELHTREAMMLFLGRDASEERRYGLPGARHAAGALRQLFVLTANDNPYADMVLIEVDARAKKIRDKIADHRTRQHNKLETLKRMGLSYSIVRAQQPQLVNLGYYSPYGYTMSTLIVLYDECVRVLKSAERRDLISRSEMHDALFSIKHEIRSLYDAVIKAQRTLCNDNMRPLSRADFVSETADAEAGKRVQAAQQILGALPQDIYAARVAPRHSMRRERISDAEQKLLDQIGRQLQEPVMPSAAEASAGLVD